MYNRYLNAEDSKNILSPCPSRRRSRLRPNSNLPSRRPSRQSSPGAAACWAAWATSSNCPRWTAIPSFCWYWCTF